tara:strand:- start:1275 stop:1523 length:249 start_codon:yes stop_codon:yes gene_type:complete
VKDKKVLASVDFLVLKIERNMSEIKLGVSKSRRSELLKYQDKLVDSLMEESEKVRQIKDLEQIENALSKLKFLRREATAEGS